MTSSSTTANKVQSNQKYRSPCHVILVSSFKTTHLDHALAEKYSQGIPQKNSPGIPPRIHRRIPLGIHQAISSEFARRNSPGTPKIISLGIP